MKTQKRVLTGALIIIIAALVVAIAFDYFVLMGKIQNISVLFIYCRLSNGRELVQDIFLVIWTTAVAVAIFIMEISNEYKYGITLKKIVMLVLKSQQLLKSAILYLLFCPFYLIAEIMEAIVTEYVICIFAFAGLIYGVIFWISMTSGTKIRELLMEETIRILNSHASEVRYPVDEVIEHIDYSISDDAKHLTETLVCICKKCEEANIFSFDKGKYTWLSDRIYQIILQFDISDRYHRIQLGDFLWELRESFFSDRSEEMSVDIQYTVQFFLPMIDMESCEINEVLFRLLRRMGNRVELIFPYLLCYSEYIIMSRKVSGNFWLFQEDICLKNAAKTMLFSNGSLVYNIALEMWIDWETRQKYNDNYGLNRFFGFTEDIQRVEIGMPEMARTYTIKYICGRFGHA